MKTDAYIGTLIRHDALQTARQKNADAVAKKTLRPSEAWLLKIATSFPQTAAGDSLDEQAAAVLHCGFAKRLILSTYGKLEIGKRFAAMYPLSAAEIAKIYQEQPLC